MSTRVRVRECVPADEQGVRELFAKHFGFWSCERWLQRRQWEYHGARGCDDCQPLIQVAEADGAIVGHSGAFVLPLRIGTKRVAALCAADLVVEAKHRWAVFGFLKNLLSTGMIILGTGASPAAKKLFEHYGAKTLALSGIRYVYPLRYGGVTRRELRARLPASSRWLVNRCSVALACAVLNLKRGRRAKAAPRVTRSGAIVPVSRFGEEYDALWRCVARQFHVCLDKDAAYLNWRYLDCPTVAPLCLACHDARGELAGIVIASRRVGLDVTRRPCGWDGEILELIVRTPDRRIVEQLLVPVIAEFNRARVDSVIATGLSRPLHAVLEELGFVRTVLDGGGLFAIDPAPNQPLAKMMRDECWYFSGGDCDGLFDILM